MRTPPTVGPARSIPLSSEPAEGTSQPGRASQTQRVASQFVRPQSGPLAGLNPSFTPKFRRADPAEVKVPVLVDPGSAQWLSHVVANERNPAVATAVGEFLDMQMYGMTTAPVTSTDPSVRMASTTFYDLDGNRQDIVARLEKGEILDRLTDVHVRINRDPQPPHFTRADVEARRNAEQGWAACNPAQGENVAMPHVAAASTQSTLNSTTTFQHLAPSFSAAEPMQPTVRWHNPQDVRERPMPHGAPVDNRTPTAGTSSFGADARSGAAVASGSGSTDTGAGVVRHAPRTLRAEPYPASSSAQSRPDVTIQRRKQLEQNATAWKAKRGIPDDMIGDTTDDELADDNWKVRNNAQTKLRKRMVWAENPEHMRSIIHRSREKRAKEIFGEGANGQQYGKLFSEANKGGLSIQQAALRPDITDPIRASGPELAANDMIVEEQLAIASRVTQNRSLPPEQQMSDTAIAREGGVSYTSVYLERRRQEEVEASWINQFEAPDSGR